MKTPSAHAQGIEEPDWRFANCRGCDTDEFFHPVYNSPEQRRALRICRACPIKFECRAWGMGRGEVGMWGGVFLSWDNSHPSRLTKKIERADAAP